MDRETESIAGDDAILSDIEDDDMEENPVSLHNSQSEASSEQLKAVLLELESERQARKAAEDAKAKVEETFIKLKSMVREAINKRDEALKIKDEALRQRDDAFRQKVEILREKEGIVKRLEETINNSNEISRVKEEISKAQEASRSEIESSAQLLISAVDKISGKVNGIKKFNGSLPRSSKYSGLAAVTYGVTKRVEEIVEDLVRQNEVTTKERNNLHEQMDQRNIEIAIEVSELEAAISSLKEDVAHKSKDLESLQSVISAKDSYIAELQLKMSNQLQQRENEFQTLKKTAEESEEKFRNLELKMVKHKSIVSDQLKHNTKAQVCLQDIIKIIDEQTDFSEPVFVSQDLDIDKDFVISATKALFVSELAEMAQKKLILDKEIKNREIRSMEDTIIRLESEKKNITALFKSALKERNVLEKELFSLENNRSMKNVEFTKSDTEGPSATLKHGSSEEDIMSLASTMENILKASQLEIQDLRQSLEVARNEIDHFRQLSEIQEKDLAERDFQIKELGKKEMAANENVANLLVEFAAAEEEASRWKEAAENEAAAGKSVMKELQEEINSLKHSLRVTKESLVEANSKLKSKVEIAAAAMSARDLAERSLLLADERSSQLRARIEELTKQVEELDGRDDGQNNRRARYKCWPLQWLGSDSLTTYIRSNGDPTTNPAEMELSHPLL